MRESGRRFTDSHFTGAENECQLIFQDLLDDTSSYCRSFSFQHEGTVGIKQYPQWQIDAGGKMAFEVTSVKRNTSGPPPSAQFPNASGDIPNSNLSLGPDDAYVPTGGLFTGTNLSLLNYMVFAYKPTGSEVQLLRNQLPKWATADLFDILARAEGNPTKDQMRLMMQSLLADRFKLAVHFETRQIPTYGLVLVRPGKTGPQLQPHSGASKCPPAPDGAASGPPQTATDGFPTICGEIVRMPSSAPGRVRLGARNVAMPLVENDLAGMAVFGDVDRPVLGQTGLAGTFDFSFEWTLPLPGPSPSRPSESGPTFLEALKDQLGLKLDSQKGPVDVLVIDHVEEPSAN